MNPRALGACVLVWLSLLGCAHKPASSTDVERAKAMPAFLPDRNAAPTRSLIEVRVLTVAYQGARGAAADQKRTREQALERARMLVSMAHGGERLGQLVGDYSDRAGASEDRGVMRLRIDQPAPFDAELARTALALPVGGISEPVAQPEGFVIVERMPDPTQGPERIGAKHILIGYAGSPKELPNVTRTEAEARALAAQVAREVAVEGADWNAIVAKYTDEAAGKTTGGDLGKFGRGQMVPAFEHAAFALEVGETSAVTKSPFGFHIIRRYE